jgi:hypothetical protein
MNLLSGVRLGLGLKLLPGLSVYTLNQIMIFTQSAHLEQSGRKRPSDETGRGHLPRQLHPTLLAREDASSPRMKARPAVIPNRGRTQGRSAATAAHRTTAPEKGRQ